MNENFAIELDGYEREVAVRAGSLAAAEARREMAAHLDADFAARLEIGLSPEQARAGALAALGDLGTIAQAEPTFLDGERIARHRVAKAALLVAPALLACEWFIPQAVHFQTRGGILLVATVAILIAAFRAPDLRRPWLWGFVGGGGIAWATTLLIAMLVNLDRTGIFGLPRLANGNWFESVVAFGMFGLPTIVLYRIASALFGRTRRALDARWVRRA